IEFHSCIMMKTAFAFLALALILAATTDADPKIDVQVQICESSEECQEGFICTQMGIKDEASKIKVCSPSSSHQDFQDSQEQQQDRVYQII
ncbi:Hypothetical protein FKW44_018581, partial [Caligus rogercresseyi]